MLQVIMYKPPTNVFNKPFQHFLRKCKLSCIMLKKAKHTLKTLRYKVYMFRHFSTLCMKGLTKHYLDAAFIPIKSYCMMVKWSIRVKMIQFMLMECHDHLHPFQSFLILQFPAPSRIPGIPKEKNLKSFFCS